MPDPRFHAVQGPFTIADLAGVAGAETGPGTDPALTISDVAPLDRAGPGDITFFDNPRYLSAFRVSKAAACIVHPDRVDQAPDGMALLVTPAPYMAYAKVAAAFYPEPTPDAGLGQGACVDPSAKIGEGVAIGPGAVIEAGAEIGAGCVIGPNAVVGRNVVMGEDCRIGANASLAYCVLGAGVRLAAGVRIGEAGFGFASGAEGHVTVPQLGRVVIEDAVDIGANTTIDRGAGPDTVIGAGSRIDNLVQIGHNVRIGRGCIIVAQVGVSGSTVLEDFVVLGGQVGVAGHLTVGKGSQIAAQGGVMQDVPPGSKLGGTPAVPLKQFMRQCLLLAKMAKKDSKGDG
jgi:UDP-3-O-[3-hydroxymyristoyl] glucosamine N-acyltransferase